MASVYTLSSLSASTNLSQITSATKPTTRVDGSALVIGDRWFNTSTNIDGFWNGTYWLSIELFQYCFAPDGSIVLPVGVIRAPLVQSPLLPSFFAVSVGLRGGTNGGIHDGVNFVSVLWEYFTSITQTTIGTINSNPWSASEYKEKETVVNAVASNCNGLQATVSYSGTAIARMQTYLKYRAIL